MRARWTGPLDSDLRADGTTLRESVPPERWPFGPPEAHEDCCVLHTGGLFCDCAASVAEEERTPACCDRCDRPRTLPAPDGCSCEGWTGGQVP